MKKVKKRYKISKFEKLLYTFTGKNQAKWDFDLNARHDLLFPFVPIYSLLFPFGSCYSPATFGYRISACYAAYYVEISNLSVTMR